MLVNWYVICIIFFTTKDYWEFDISMIRKVKQKKLKFLLRDQKTMRRNYLATVLILGILMIVPGMANATLLHFGNATYNGSDYKLIYDDGQDLIWLDYTQDKDTWDNQMIWASGLNDPGVLVYDIFSGFSVAWTETDSWRLPSALNDDGSGPDWGTGVTQSDLGYLFYVEMGLVPGATAADLNAGEFDNLVASWYWTNTMGTSNWAMIFGMFNGGQGASSTDTTVRALAVRGGQVTQTPLPAAVWMMGAGIASLMLWTRRKEA